MLSLNWRALSVCACVLASGALFSAPAEADTHTITASRDSYLRSANVNDNFGTASELTLKTTSGDLFRDVFYFDLSSIPAGETVTAATLQFYITDGSSATVNVHRITDSWAENTVTWSNTAADLDATSSGSFSSPASAAFSTASITALVQAWRLGTTNNGVMLIASTLNDDIKVASREWGTSSQRPRLTVTTSIAPNFALTETTQISSDPYNGTTNPKRIPGAAVGYTVTVTNSGAGSPTANSVIVTAPIPADTKLYVNDLGGAGSGPATFTNGSPSSTLTYTFTSLASTTDNLSFSNNGGTTYTYTPTADADGYDAAVTHMRANPQGTFAAASGGSPSFNLQFRVAIE
jgi:hypothetical protein